MKFKYWLLLIVACIVIVGAATFVGGQCVFTSSGGSNPVAIESGGTIPMAVDVTPPPQ